MKKVFALFRNPSTYIDPLLSLFALKTELFVAFSVKMTHEAGSLSNVNHIYLKHGNLHRFQMGNDYFLIQPDVSEYISKSKYDAVFIATSYWSLSTWFALIKAKKERLPVVTRMTVILEKKRNPIVSTLKRLVVGLYCHLVDAGVYECMEQRKYFLKYGMKNEQLFFAPCAVDNKYFQKEKNKHNKIICRKEVGISDETFVIIFTGQLISRKRPMDIIRASEKWIKRGHDVIVFLLGAGRLENEIMNYIHLHKLEKNIILCGKVDHETMSRYLSMGDLYVLPSEYDASPKALNEAMNFGLPILISDGVKTSNELCQSGENGFVYPVGNVKILSDYIHFFLTNRIMADTMGDRSIDIVKKFNYNAVTQAWLEAVEYCMNKG